jgi:phage terminase large subunit-like protein
VIISTAGNGDKTHPSYQQYSLAKSVLDGTSEDIHLLPAIYECSEEVRTPAEIYDPQRLIAANPVLQEDAEKRRLALEELKEYKRNKQNAWWKRFRLNQWLPQDGDEYIDLDLYQKAEVESEPDLSGAECYVGIDKGGTWDFSALAFFFKLPDGRLFERHYTFAVADRLPEMQAKDDMDYGQFKGKGLTIIPSNVVADKWLTEWALKEFERYNVIKVGADKHNADYILESFQSAGYDIVGVSQSNNAALTPVIDDYLERIRQGKLTHTKNELVDWQLNCCRRFTTSKSSCKLVKQGSNIRGTGGSGHIDNIDAAINALAVLRAAEIQEISYTGGCVVG